MFLNREIRRRYQLTKNQLDGLVWRFAEAWGLIKDEKGQRVWNSVAITHLEEYLSTRRGEIIAASVDPDAAGNAIVKRSDTLEIARAFGEKMDAALARQGEIYKKEMAELKEHLAHLTQELAQVRAAVTPRAERRHPPVTLWEKFCFYVLEPRREFERRKA